MPESNDLLQMSRGRLFPARPHFAVRGQTRKGYDVSERQDPCLDSGDDDQEWASGEELEDLMYWLERARAAAGRVATGVASLLPQVL